jgi:hypothetical protein
MLSLFLSRFLTIKNVAKNLDKALLLGLYMLFIAFSLLFLPLLISRKIIVKNKKKLYKMLGCIIMNRAALALIKKLYS